MFSPKACIKIFSYFLAKLSQVNFNKKNYSELNIYEFIVFLKNLEIYPPVYTFMVGC